MRRVALLTRGDRFIPSFKTGSFGPGYLLVSSEYPTACRRSRFIGVAGSFIQSQTMTKSAAYTCVDYREEMILLGLRRHLEDPDLSEEEKQVIRSKIQELEKSLDM